MPAICNSCGGSFKGVGPGPEWGHDSLACSNAAPQRERIAELREIVAALLLNWPTTEAAGLVNGWPPKPYLTKSEALRRAAEVVNTSQ